MRPILDIDRTISEHTGHFLESPTQTHLNCPACGKTKHIRTFCYRCKPLHQAHLNPRLIIGSLCNACRRAWIKQDIKRIANALADQSISAVDAELWARQLKAKQQRAKSEALKKAHRIAKRYKPTLAERNARAAAAKAEHDAEVATAKARLAHSYAPPNVKSRAEIGATVQANVDRLKAESRAESVRKQSTEYRNARAAAAHAPAKGTVINAEPANPAPRDILKEWGL